MQRKFCHMRNIFFRAGIFFMTCSFSGVIFGQEQTGTPMTFDQAMQYMQTNSHVLKQAGFQVNEKEAARKATMGLRAPKIGLTGTAVQMSDPLHLDLTPVRDAITPLYSALGHYGNFSGVPNPDPATSGAMPVLPDSYSTQAVRASLLEGLEKINAAEWDQMIQEKQFASLSASVMWPLFTGGKINAANKASELYQEEAELQRDQKQGELLSELVTRYYGLVLARQAKQVRQQVFDAMNKHLYDAQKLSEQGQIARVEFLHAQVAQADAERELKKAAREVDILERALQNTLAMPDTISVLPASPLFMIKTIEDEGYFTQMALVNNPLLKQVDSKKALAAVGLKAEKSNYLPSVALTGMYDLANKDLSPYVPDWMVGLGLKWTLFDGMARYRNVQAARFKQDQVEQAGMKAEEDIQTGIKKLYEQLNMQIEQLDQLDKTLDFAKTYLESRDKAFREGLSTSTELVDANLLVAKVKIDRLQVFYQYDVTLATLLQVCGKPELFATYLAAENIITEKL